MQAPQPMRALVLTALALLAGESGALVPAQSAGSKPLYFTTQQDHFDGSNYNTWQQAYYINDTYWKGPDSGAPVFVCVGGEGPALTGEVLIASPHCNNAVEWLPEVGALMFAVEHRYYGCHNASACPVDDVSAPGALKFLSSRQALGDLVAFHGFATQEYGLTAANRWVSWGGSYPGMLAGWLRLKFPNLVHAAVASSAPVQAQVDMVGYNDVVAYAYSATSVGGSDACLEAIASGHKTIGDLMNGSDADREYLGSVFDIRDPSRFKVKSYQASFAGNGVANFPAQSNEPTCTSPACNVDKICQLMTNTTLGTDVERLAQVRKAQSFLGADAVNGVKEQRLEMHARPPTKRTGAMASAFEPDYWYYQTCTEFAFYQTCEVGSKCMFTQGLVTLDGYLDSCQSSFGITAEEVAQNVAYTNEYYGGSEPAGTRVMWPNGEVDPWQALSVLVQPNREQPIMMVTGASHHAWTHPSAPTDSPELVQAREAIRKQVAEWLKEDDDDVGVAAKTAAY
mmetsp:Transcript_1312/g.4564  ORF Transcript_1312/g.4564 Transcript_1312/m.4564 type:complete len:511 (+) Transcript_1312:65-1597(+)